jgi:hypothetical protein
VSLIDSMVKMSLWILKDLFYLCTRDLTLFE